MEIFMIQSNWSHCNCHEERNSQRYCSNTDLTIKSIQFTYSLALYFYRCILKSPGYELIHLPVVKAKRAHIRIKHFAKNCLKFHQFIFWNLLINGLHPMRHHFIPYFQGDDIIWNKTEKSNQSFLDVIGSCSYDVPVSTDFGIIRRIWK